MNHLPFILGLTAYLAMCFVTGQMIGLAGLRRGWSLGRVVVTASAAAIPLVLLWNLVEPYLAP